MFGSNYLMNQARCGKAVKGFFSYLKSCFKKAKNIFVEFTWCFSQTKLVLLLTVEVYQEGFL